MSSQVNDFFKNFLDNKTCYVKSEGLQVSTGIEIKCHLIADEYWGLGLYSDLEYGNKDISKKVIELTEDRKLFPFGVLLEYMRGDFISKLKKFEIQIGRIYTNNIKRIDSIFEEGDLKYCSFTFKDGSVCELSCIEPYKSKE